MILENTQVQTVNCLPHVFPFRFVDDVLLGEKQIFVTEKKAEIFPDNKPFHYPHALLIEHAAQTMFIHGYHIGLSEGWWGEQYNPTGFLTGLSNARFTNYEIQPQDSILTKTEVIRICRPMLIVKTTITIFGQIVLFEGTISGIFTNEVCHKKTRQDFEVSNEVDRIYFDRDHKGTFFNSNNWFLPGHFPDFKCYPGCLIIEGVKQSIHPNLKFSCINKARFRKVMTPDNKYYFITSLIKDNRYSFVVIENSSEAICAEGEFEV